MRAVRVLKTTVHKAKSFADGCCFLYYLLYCLDMDAKLLGAGEKKENRVSVDTRFIYIEDWD